MIVILGGSGYIGQNILRHLEREGMAAKGTYFKNKQPGLEYFDLENRQLYGSVLSGPDVQYLVISAAVEANIDGTRINWERAYHSNVTRLKAIIDFCFENQITPVYISTDNVFDGEKGNYREGDTRNPQNGYGEIKYEVENYLLNSGFEFIIVRVGKVFGDKPGDNTLLTSLIGELKQGKQMLCAVDQVFTPIYIRDLTSAISYLIKNQCAGVFHLASLEATSRYKIAIAIADYFQI